MSRSRLTGARFRCALLPEKKILPTSFVDIAGPAGVVAFASEVKRSAASHKDAKAPRFEAV